MIEARWRYKSSAGVQYQGAIPAVQIRLLCGRERPEKEMFLARRNLGGSCRGQDPDMNVNPSAIYPVPCDRAVFSAVGRRG